MPAWDDAVDEETAIGQVLPQLLGRGAPLAVRRGGRVVGQAGIGALHAMLRWRDE